MKMLAMAEPGEELDRLMAMPPLELAAEYDRKIAILQGLA